MGYLMVVDGLDGSGKSTQLEQLSERLKNTDRPFRRISFPDYDSPSSALVRMYLRGDFGGAPGDVNAYASSSFYAVDRFASYKTGWERDYRAGALILAARYTTSNAIHQMPKLPKDQWDGYLRWMEHYEYDLLGLPRPDLTVFLDMPPEVAEQLILARYQGDPAKKDIHERDAAYLRSCREAALHAAERLNWIVIKCAENNRPLPPEQITEQIFAICNLQFSTYDKGSF